MRNLLLKIQNLPESKRKIILWAVTVILALGLLSFYIKNIQKKFKSLEVKEFKKELQSPFLEELKKLPKIEIPKTEIPEINQEGLKESEQMIEK